jgi:hypothetical protein
MPKGPQGQKRPADVISNAVRVMRIATGEEETLPKSTARTVFAYWPKAAVASNPLIQRADAFRLPASLDLDNPGGHRSFLSRHRDASAAPPQTR